MTVKNHPNRREPDDKAHVLLFVLFLIILAIVLHGMGWCIGGVCEIGTDMLLS